MFYLKCINVWVLFRKGFNVRANTSLCIQNYVHCILSQHCIRNDFRGLLKYRLTLIAYQKIYEEKITNLL